MARSAETKSGTWNPNLQSSVAAVDVDEVVNERMLLDNLTRLADWADAAGLVARDPLRVGWLRHFRRKRQQASSSITRFP